MPKDVLGHGSDPIEGVRQKWDEMGVDHHISSKNGVVNVSKIVVPPSKRNEGIGSRAMNVLNQAADQHGLRVTLTPSNAFGGNPNRLTRFYKRQGFHENKGRSRDLSISETMIREPQGR